MKNPITSLLISLLIIGNIDAQKSVSMKQYLNVNLIDPVNFSDDDPTGYPDGNEIDGKEIKIDSAKDYPKVRGGFKILGGLMLSATGILVNAINSREKCINDGQYVCSENGPSLPGQIIGYSILASGLVLLGDGIYDLVKRK